MRILWRIVVVLTVLLAAGVGFAWWYDHVGQRSDPNFSARVPSPTYPSEDGQHPMVLMDEAHRNFHTASGRYKPFADLLRSDGYIVLSNQQTFTPEALRNVVVLVIANAMGPADHETRPAFSQEEETVLEEWVRDGGSLFLISDHSPFGSASAHLAKKFGVTMYLRYARDDQFHDGWDNERLDFSRSNGLLADSEITSGRSASERVNHVVTFYWAIVIRPTGYNTAASSE